MKPETSIPVIPVDELLAGRAQELVMKGATGSGFLTLSGVDAHFGTSSPRQTMLGFFTAGAKAKALTLRHKYDPSKTSVYRGYFPAEPEKNALLEGFDIGPDIVDAARAGDGADPLTEPTPRPDIADWDEAAGTYYHAMEELGFALARSLLAGLGAEPELAERLFTGSISTLRLLRYPPYAAQHLPAERRLAQPDGSARYVMTGEHTDSGFITLLWQDDTGGLQAKAPGESWRDVPPAEGGLVVNFGQMLGDWSGGRIKATPHRVLGGLAERISVPFFFEPAVDAVIAPLTPGQGQPFVYGEFLWERMVRFPNFHGVERKPAA